MRSWTAWLRTAAGYEFYLVAVAVGAVVLRLLLGLDVPASGLAADDYDYLGKSIYYIRGDFSASGFPFGRAPAGILYPILVSPWQLFHAPADRVFALVAVNAFFGGVTVYFASRAVLVATEFRSLLAPVLLATLGSGVLFTFVALTENLMFPFLAAGAWLAATSPERRMRPAWIAGFVLTVAGASLVRAPGVAVLIALVAVLLMQAREAGWWRSVALIAGGGFAVVAAYGLSTLAVGPTMRGDSYREEAYLTALGKIFSEPSEFLTLVVRAMNQLWYIIISGGFWPIVAAIFAVALLRSAAVPRAFKALLTYTLVACGVLISLALLHITRKLAAPEFIYGRYADPPTLLAFIAGLAALTVPVAKETRVARVLMRVVGPVLFVFAFSRVLEQSWWHMNQSGLSFFPRKMNVSPGFIVGVAVVVTLISQLPRRWLWPVSAVAVLWFNVKTIDNGMDMIRTFAGDVDRGAEAADWIVANVPEDQCVAYDYRVASDRAVGSRKKMVNVYASMFHFTWPRPFSKYRGGVSKCRYIYTNNSTVPESGWVSAWRNAFFTLYEQTDQRRGAREPLNLAEFRVSQPKMQRGAHLLMAWHGGTATSPVQHVPAGEYVLRLTVEGQGCQDPPPELLVRVQPGIAELTTPALQGVREIDVPFSVDEPTSVSLFLRNDERPACPGVDKNILVHRVVIEGRAGNSEVTP